MTPLIRHAVVFVFVTLLAGCPDYYDTEAFVLDPSSAVLGAGEVVQLEASYRVDGRPQSVRNVSWQLNGPGALHVRVDPDDLGDNARATYTAPSVMSLPATARITASADISGRYWSATSTIVLGAGGSVDPPDDGVGPVDEVDDAAIAEGILWVLVAGRLHVDEAEQYSLLAVASTAYAGMNGAAEPQGTVTWRSGMPTGYATRPADRLVVDYDGLRLTYAIHDMYGAISLDPEGFMAGDHSLSYTLDFGADGSRVAVDDGARAQRLMTVNGRTPGAGATPTEWSARFEGNNWDRIDLGSADHQRAWTSTGSLRTAKAEVQLDEAALYRYIQIDGQPALETAEHASKSRATFVDWPGLTGHTLRLRDVYIRYELRGGRGENAAVFWRARGAAELDGHAVGTFALRVTAEYARIVLATDHGDIELRTFRR